MIRLQISPAHRRLFLALTLLFGLIPVLVLRPDFFSFIPALSYSLFGTSPAIQSYLHSAPVRKLQIGAGGNNLAGWLNSDLTPRWGQIFLDASKPFPLPDGSFQFVFSEHMIEHIPYEKGSAMLRECHRILASGGRLRLVTPDLSKFVGLVGEQMSDAQMEFIRLKVKIHGWPTISDPACLVLNRQMHDWGHQFLYTRKLLEAELRAAGFREVEFFAPGQTRQAAFRGAEMRPSAAISAVNDFEAMAVEAVK